MWAAESAAQPRGRLALLLCTSLGAEASGQREEPLTFSQFDDVCQRWAACTGTREDVLIRAGEGSLRAVFPREMAERIFRLRRGRKLSEALHRLAMEGITALCQDEEGFPAAIQQGFEGKVPFLFVQGERALLQAAPAAAVVGTRDAGEDALAFARDLGGHCARHGITVVSGGAAGVDSAALRAVIKEGGGGIFMLPCGLQSRDARRWLAQLGGHYLLVSPFPLDSGFSTPQAMLRNRLIYRLSQLAVVVSAHKGRGGSWRGAVEALAKRDNRVFVRHSGEAGNIALHEKGAAWLHEPRIAQLLIDDL